MVLEKPTIYCSSLPTGFKRITVFLASYSADRNAAKVIEYWLNFLDKDLMCAEMDPVTRFSIYLDFLQYAHYSCSYKDMAERFPEIIFGSSA